MRRNSKVRARRVDITGNCARIVASVAAGAALAGAMAWVARLAVRVEVVGPSMAPTLADGDRVLVNCLVYRWRSPRAGEIVLAHVPNVPGGLTIKRVARGGLWRDQGESGRCASDPRLPGWPSGYVLLGDNSGASTDSRSFGLIGRQQIRGRVWYRYWPPARRGPID